MTYICMRIKNYFHIALSLAWKKGLEQLLVRNKPGKDYRLSTCRAVLD